MAIEKMYEHIIERLEQAIAKHHAKDKVYDGNSQSTFSTEMFDKDVEKVSKEEYKTLILNCRNVCVKYNLHYMIEKFR